jgi:2-polyprenyl-6-methoxyphenol hydroxylase-like FAD-dependent oxidoreductase
MNSHSRYTAPIMHYRARLPNHLPQESFMSPIRPAARLEKRDHAIVIGASLAGLLTARVLSQSFTRVTLLERDPVFAGPEARKGQPQTRHLHGLLATGLQVMARYFPDLPEALRTGGAMAGDFAESMRWYSHGGYRKTFQMGVNATTMSRPFLEALIRQRVLALPNVTLLDNASVKSLLASPDRQTITGVVLEQRNAGRTTDLSADLIVDAGGRGSRSPQWLVELGFDPPPTTEVKVDVGYATRLYRRDPADPRGQQWTLVTPDAPRETRFGGMFAVEGDLWIVSVGGWGGDHAPTDAAGFLNYVRALPAPDIYDVIARAEPLSEITPYKFPLSLRRHYEKLRRFPLGYLVLGDAIASFNPTYGQGMTSAALQVAELDRLLRSRTTLAGLAPAFFRRAARVVDIPWQLAVGEDFRFPTTHGQKPAGIDFLNRYVARVHRATLHDEVVGLAFLKVMNLMAPPASLFHPRLLWRALRPPPRAARRAPRLDSPPASA